MVAVWIILGFLAGFIASWVLGYANCLRNGKFKSINEIKTYAAAAFEAKKAKNETNQPVSVEINYTDYSETLELK